MPTDTDQLEQNVVSLFSSEVLDRGKAMMKHEARIYQDPAARAIFDTVAQNWIYEQAGVSYPDRPVTANVHAAARLAALAVAMIHTDAPLEVLAAAANEIGVLGKRMADIRRAEQQKQFSEEGRADPVPLSSAARGTHVDDVDAAAPGDEMLSEK